MKTRKGENKFWEGRSRGAIAQTGTGVIQLLTHPFCGVRAEVSKLLKNLAGTTGLEPATSDVTGRRSNQLNYVPLRCVLRRQCHLNILAESQLK